MRIIGSPPDPFLPLAIPRESMEDDYLSILNTSTDQAVYARPLSADSIEKIKNVNGEIRVNEIHEDEN